MGEVWRATDTKLGRDVAIKALPGALAHDAERLARFEREARVLASLNHSNIAAIYGLEEDHGTRFLILELVEGPSLADTLERGALVIDEALKLAVQIAEALEAAHEQGIIHRDLKPSNIKLRPDGVVKVLDFGLAKAMDSVGHTSPDATRSPTITSPAITQTGMILGTAAYMAPEQALGKSVDRRADIWAFGCVLYEMLTGKIAFRGEVVADTLAAVIRAEPDWQLLPPATPPRVEALLRRCLKKDVRQRLQAVGDARIVLEEVLSGEGASEISPPRTTARKMWLIGSLVGLSIAIATGLATWNLKPASPTPPRSVSRQTITLPPGQRLAEMTNGKPILALAPDEKHLAYVAVQEGQEARQIYLWSFEEGTARAVANTAGADTPFFSADGQWLGFYNGQNRLMKVPVRGGVAEPLMDIVNPYGVSWIGDRRIAVASLGSVLQTLSDDGRTLQPLTRFDTAETLHQWPSFLPGNNSVLFSVISDRSAITVQSLGANEHRAVIEGGDKAMPAYSPSGHVIYAQAGNLMAVPFDLERLEVRAKTVPTQVMSGVLQVRESALFSVSAAGSLAYVPGEFLADYSYSLVQVNRDGTERRAFRVPPRFLYQPRLSPDGRRVAMDVREGSVLQVWLYDIEREQLSPFTYPDERDNRHPLWTPDSKRILYQSGREGTRQLFSQAADGGELERLTSFDPPSNDVDTYTYPSSFCHDGRLIFGRLVPTGEIWMLDGTDSPAQSRKPVRLDFPMSVDGAPELSPDCRWLAYVHDESGRREVYVRAFPSLDNKRLISTGGGSEPMWNPDPAKHELFYRNGHDMMAVELSDQGIARKPEKLFAGPYLAARGGAARQNYDVFSDGSFLMVKPEAQKRPLTQIIVVLGWSEELKRRVPAEVQ